MEESEKLAKVQDSLVVLSEYPELRAAVWSLAEKCNTDELDLLEYLIERAFLNLEEKDAP